MGTEILCAEGALTVRRFREGDLPALAALLADPEVMRWLEPPFDRARAAEFLRTAGLSEPPLIYAAEEDGAFLGYVIFHRYGDEDAAELGWVLRRSGLCRALDGTAALRCGREVGRGCHRVRAGAALQRPRRGKAGLPGGRDGRRLPGLPPDGPPGRKMKETPSVLSRTVVKQGNRPMPRS